MGAVGYSGISALAVVLTAAVAAALLRLAARQR